MELASDYANLTCFISDNSACTNVLQCSNPMDSEVASENGNMNAHSKNYTSKEDVYQNAKMSIIPTSTAKNVNPVPKTANNA